VDNEQTSANPVEGRLTQHAMLVVWGLYAQRIGLIEQLEQVKLKQKQRDHTPQRKVLEFLVAILAGLPYLKDISLAAHPLDQDVATAEAWGQEAWADYSGVSRTLQKLSQDEVQDISDVLSGVSQPFIDQETELALQRSGRLVYDADLTGRPVSSTSTSYPDTAFGYMGDSVSLGYQAALISLHSPTYGRLWLANQLHPGDTVSSTQAQAMVKAAEAHTGLRPRRRTELVARRLAQAEAELATAEVCYQESCEKLTIAEAQAKETASQLAQWRQQERRWATEYRDEGRRPSPHCKLLRARRKVTTYEQRLPRNQSEVDRAQRRLKRHERSWNEASAQVEHLRSHYASLLEENETNPVSIEAVFRLDGGFASCENIAWLLEMGYDVYTKARSTKVRELLIARVSDETDWQQVGGNARLTAWADTTVDGHLPYPMNVALAHYQTGDTHRHAVLLHYGQKNVTENLDDWFHMYNARQTIEAGIKEGKGVFQMHHLKVRSSPALLLQEHLACFAANFVRFAAHWLTQHRLDPLPIDTTSVKQMVQVCAHTSAWVRTDGDVWLLTFTEQSRYAGCSLLVGNGAFQLPLPLYRSVHSHHF
jgi:hypothetical protein